MKIFSKLPKFLKPQKRWQKIVFGIVIVLLIIIIARSIFGSNTDEQKDNKKTKIVEVARVFDIANKTTNLPVVGKAESQSEAILRAESQGEISYVRKSLGDNLRSGEIIAEIKNDSQRADVLRASGVYDAAKANLIKVENNSSQAENLIKGSIFSSYSNSLDAVKNKVDQFITDADTKNPKVNASVGDDKTSYFDRQEIERQRIIIGDLLDAWAINAYSVNDVSSAVELEQRFNESKANLESVRDFLVQVANTVNETKASEGLSQSTVDKYKSDVSSAVSSVNSSLNSLISAYNAYSSQVNLGGDSQDILSAKAQLTQARAGLLSAQANLEKTIVRSPITGVLNSINIKQGDVVSQFQDLGEVVGNGEIEIIAFINESDRKTVEVGSEVIIENDYRGEVIRMAPSLNQTTQKIEIRISVPQDSQISNGESVSLEIVRKVNKEKESTTIIVPLTAVKITGDKSNVFTVNQEGVLESKEVKIGDIIGEYVEIDNGIDLSTAIVIDSRGLKEGDKVEVK